MPAIDAPVVELSLKQARRIGLSAIGLGRQRPSRAGPGAFGAMIDRLAMLQIDSVNVLTRAHYMPGFSRLGAYDPELLDRASRGKKRKLFEYWGHEASFIAIRHQPNLRWRMEAAREGKGTYASLARFAQEKRAFVDAVLGEVEKNGPLVARDLSDGGRGSGGWWGWSEGKLALEWLFWAGLVTAHSRRGFERLYDLPERVMPDVCALPTPFPQDAQRQLILAAARSLGIATIGDLRSYWRIGPQDATPRVAELVEAGDLIPATVKGWRQPAFLAKDLDPARRPAASALISPFDPLLWERDRAERLLDFRYRIEIYTPAHKREHGYYVMPFLLGDRIVARLDLKADRAGSRLVVQSAHREGTGRDDEVIEALARELQRLAGWLRLAEIKIEPVGDLGRALGGAFAAAH